MYERGKEVYFGAFGLADRENNKPMTRDTIVQIFSMTKPVTGVALMQLYERGKFELDEPLAVYAPEFADVKVYAGLDASGQPKYEAPKRPITVRDILRHTAGFHGDGSPEAVAAIYRADRSAQLQQHAARVSARARQGAARAINPARSGCTATPSTCRPTSCRRSPACRSTSTSTLHILTPLGMTTTRYTILPTDPDRPQLAAIYTRNDDGTFTRQSDEEAYRFNSAALAATSPAASVSCRPSTTT